MNDNASGTPWPLMMAASPKPDEPRRPDEGHPAEPPAPGPDQAPHEHPDDPGVHPDGPKRYHDDHAAPARQRLDQEVVQRVEQGVDQEVAQGEPA